MGPAFYAPIACEHAMSITLASNRSADHCGSNQLEGGTMAIVKSEAGLVRRVTEHFEHDSGYVEFMAEFYLLGS